ncbi:MAG: dicarboxylate--CoA ligase PimA [Magnetococcales bacterium]|nr:dicarboxylate--CoA ligase PimA [Magnetococcales bacterium]
MSHTAKSMKPHLWEKSYPENMNWAFTAKSQPVYRLLETAAENHPDRICADFLGREYAYDEIMRMANQVAKGLQDLGMKKGDRIGLCLPNCPYYIAAYFGAMKAGCTVVNFNPLYTQEELEYQINDSGIRLMFTLDVEAIYEKVEKSVDHTQLSKIVVCSLPGALSCVKSILFKLFKGKELATIEENNTNILFTNLIANDGQPTKVEISPENDIALLQYTGGTTGVPKGAMLTHENVYSNAAQVRLWLGDVDENGERFLGVIPFFHVFAMTAVMNLAIHTASRIIMYPRFNLDDTLKAIHKLKPTIFPGVPTIFNAINNHKDILNYNLSSLKYCISGGATLPEQVRDTFVNLTGCKMVEGYGLSECSPVATCNPPHTGGKPNAIGIPLPGTCVEIRDLDKNEKVLPTGERGEVFIRGPQVMKGYWGKEEATKETLIDDWLKTGDVGYMDEDGYVFLTDRLKEIIITSGYNVYPRMIEEAFYKNEMVEEVIVIGIPDDNKGEVPKAFVKLKADAHITKEELLTFVKSRLNPIEKPAEIEFRDELPKTLIGKLSKKELIAEEKEKRNQK